jgi:cobalt-zinc-cadmium efflux system protein
MAAGPHAPRLGLQARLAAAIGLALTASAVELVGSFLSGSLALLGDAGHVGTDAMALALSLWALRIAERPHTPRMSFGYHRTEVLAAVANAVLLVVLAAFLLWRAYGRFVSQEPVVGGVMFLVGIAGLAANVAMVVLLRDWARRNINARGAFLHAYGDTLGSLGVVSAAAVIQLTSLYLVDVLVALFIVALILVSAARLFREGGRILLEASPADLRPEEVAKAILAIPGVKDVHDLHIWTVTSEFLALTGHIRVAGDTRVSDASRIVDAIQEDLRRRFGIAHATLQVDSLHDEMIRPGDVTSTNRS